MMSRFFYMLVVLSMEFPAHMLPDFSGATYVTHGTCVLNDTTVTCLEVEKQGTRYVVFYQNLEILAIYKVRQGATTPYFPEDMEQIYPLQGFLI